MFRDKEIIDMIKDLTKKIDCLCSDSEDDIFRKLEDVEIECQEIKNKLEVIDERSLRDEEDFRHLIKQSISESMEKKKPRIKEIKTEKKASKKK